MNEETAFVLLRTSPIEKQKLVFQIGTANVNRAINVAKMVQNDVSAIDINMGCPKGYSTSLGIGAALLTKVEVAKEIVQGLVENVPLPITCKIRSGFNAYSCDEYPTTTDKIFYLLNRILDDIDKSISMVKDFEKLGVSAVTVHGRTRYQTRTEAVNKGMFFCINKGKYTNRLSSFFNHSLSRCNTKNS